MADEARGRAGAHPVCATLCASLALPLPPAASEQESFEAVLDGLAPLFERTPLVDGERVGALLVVSDDAGGATAVQFWRNALATGVAFASPGAFPWCLANAPCATIARRFGVTGPNLTWLVSFADARSAFDAPTAWLADWLTSPPRDGTAAEAWLVALHLGAPSARVMVWHCSAVGSDIARGDPAALVAALGEAVTQEWSAAMRTPTM